jgi:glycosyltransferase involved in cell wall biosynthesis
MVKNIFNFITIITKNVIVHKMIILFLALIFITAIIELALGYVPNSRFQKFLGIALSAAIIGLSSAVLLEALSAWSIILSFFSIFRVINIFRLVGGRKQKKYLKAVYLRSSQYLVIYQVVILLVASVTKLLGFHYQDKWYLLAVFEILSASVILASLIRSSKRSSPIMTSKYLTDTELPSITVAIPARNETIDLDECLNSLISSDYPKIEILVLDDCSQEKKTPEIIRQFAHDGVRFVAGTQPPDNWTAKNFAYQKLIEESNGKYILFCGVDTRFSSYTLRKMIEVMIAKDKSMLSFIPVNYLPEGGGSGQIKAISLQPWRYFWELGLPRRRLNRPAVLSTCWLIDKKKLLSYGSFKAVSRNILPERYFAGRANKDNGGYGFIQSDDLLGLFCKKNFRDQYGTAIRTRYPVLKQRMELASLLALSEALIFFFPLVILYIGFRHSFIVLFIIGVLTLVINAVSFYKVVKITYQKSLPLSFLLAPFIAALDIYMLLNSMWQYEFSEVIWKGRNVCIPVMRIEPRLPDDH